MNTSASLGPVQFAGLTYLILTIVSLGVAGMIQLLFGAIKLQKSRVTAKTAVAKPHENTNPNSSAKG